ncbi:MAG TPA: porin family protein, partial [Paludibacteraceae bacterium]|nr:porin family protein [Paludibacteraceae bacterium]
MKKLALIIGLAIFSIGAFAQVTIGLKGGYNTSLGFDKNFSYTGDNFNIQNDLSHGGHLGLFFRFGRRFYVQPEANYNLNIAKVNFTDKNNAIWTDNVLLSTVDVPVLLGFKIVNAKKFNLRIMAGPKFRFNAGSDKKIENVQDLTVVARKSQIGLDAGLGLD